MFEQFEENSQIERIKEDLQIGIKKSINLIDSASLPESTDSLDCNEYLSSLNQIGRSLSEVLSYLIIIEIQYPDEYKAFRIFKHDFANVLSPLHLRLKILESKPNLYRDYVDITNRLIFNARNFLQTYQEGSLKLENVRSIEIAQMISDTIESIRTTKNIVNFEVDIPTFPLLEVQSNKPALERVFRNILLNTYRPNTGITEVHITYGFSKNRFGILIKDNGVGLRPSHFVDGYSDNEIYGGTGTGYTSVIQTLRLIPGHQMNVVSSRIGSGRLTWPDLLAIQNGEKPDHTIRYKQGENRPTGSTQQILISPQ